MNPKQIRIVFMGTPAFATESLKALVENQYNVVAVVTTPDRKAGRGQKLMECDVKKYAVSKAIPVLQPEKLRDETFLSELETFKPQLMVVVAFRMLPEVVWGMPELGTFNLHGSLLPQYRGAAPINWAVINGESKTGVSTFLIDKKIDTGNILLRTEIPITENDSAGSLHDKMMVVGAGLVCTTVDKLAEGNVEPIHQNTFVAEGEELNPAPKIFKGDCKIDWSASGEVIRNKVRGLSPYPAAWATLVSDEKELGVKLFELCFVPSNHTYPLGTLLSDDKSYIKVAVKDGFCEVLDLQLAGKKRMKTQALLLGFKNIKTFRMT